MGGEPLHRLDSQRAWQSRWRSHGPWLVVTLVALGLGMALHAAAVRGSVRAPGGTRSGLALGAAASVLVVFSSVLGMRRRFLGLPLGSMTLWLRAHLWLGSLAFALALLHAGGTAHGPLGMALLVTLGLVSASGVLGAWLQHVLPGTIDALVAADSGGSDSIRSDRSARRVLGMRRWLHAWLLLHVPLAMALLVLLAVHVLTALRF